MLARVLALLPLSLVACGPDPAKVHLEITPGQEQDTFFLEPVVTRVDIDASSLDGSIKLEASTTPSGAFDLGEVPAGERMSFEVTGVTGEGVAVVRGRSLIGLPIPIDAGTLPIFVQRTNRWSRPPGGLSRTHIQAPAGVLGEQYVYLGGGAAGSATDHPEEGDFYDLFALRGTSALALPRLPETIVSLAASTLLVDAEGATFVDGSGATTVISPPPGFSFAAVAGGRPVPAGDGRVFVVGATRRGEASSSVLIVNTDGTVGGASLTSARRGAAALWVKDVGLVVAGGSESGAGAEVLRDGATAAQALAYPADATTGAGAAMDGKGGVVLLGGVSAGAAAPTRRLDLACSASCGAVPVANADLPAPIGAVAAFALPRGRVLAVGDELEGQGMTRSFLVDLAGTVEELALREPRKGATVIPTPTGTLALLGGLHEDGSAALSVELLFPE